jgi:hypothetical protein
MTQLAQHQGTLHIVHTRQVKAVQRQAHAAGHLTTRGRRVLAILALIPMVIAMVLTGDHQASATGTAPTTKQVVVHAGESLWEIAVRVDPNSDPRQTMWNIKQLNHMSDSRLDSGQSLVVPTR